MSAPVRADRTRVYFVRVASGPIKIGVSDDVPSRVNAIRVANHEEVTLLGAVAGSLQTEDDWHARFADERIRGEWFRGSAAMLAAIAEATAMPLPLPCRRALENETRRACAAAVKAAMAADANPNAQTQTVLRAALDTFTRAARASYVPDLAHVAKRSPVRPSKSSTGGAS